MTEIPIIIVALETVRKIFETRKTGNQRKNREHRDYSIIKNYQNTEQNFGDLKRFAVTHTPVKNLRV